MAHKRFAAKTHSWLKSYKPLSTGGPQFLPSVPPFKTEADGPCSVLPHGEKECLCSGRGLDGLSPIFLQFCNVEPTIVRATAWASATTRTTELT